jgi:hypothetical protein
MKLGSLIDDDTASAGASQSRAGGGGGIREALSSGAGKTVVGIVVVILLAFAAVRIMGVVKSGAPLRAGVPYVHVETGQTRFYKVGVQPAEGYYPAEYCFQNTCGPDGGTPVILNAYLDKPGPTTCPKCGAPVVAHNPRPEGYETARPKDWDR